LQKVPTGHLDKTLREVGNACIDGLGKLASGCGLIAYGFGREFAPLAEETQCLLIDEHAMGSGGNRGITKKRRFFQHVFEASFKFIFADGLAIAQKAGVAWHALDDPSRSIFVAELKRDIVNRGRWSGKERESNGILNAI